MVVRNAVRAPVPEGALPDFTPVPRKCPRHDGWTPERQKAFIAALADTGCVKIACRMVNMSAESAYMLRRRPGAESFRAAWEAAQSLGLQVVKDEAFDRALHGELIPVFVAGKLMGFRRKKNDRLLMFILRHYGQDSRGRKTTINYFSTRATAAAGARDAGSDRPATGEAVSFDVTDSLRDAASSFAAAESTTVQTIVSQPPNPSPRSRDSEAADLINAFEGVELDAEAKAEIDRALAACAARRRALRTGWDTPRPEALARQAADPECDFLRVKPGTVEWLGALESGAKTDAFEPFDEDEPHWESIGEPPPAWHAQWLEEQEAKAANAPSNPPLDFEGRGTADAAVEGPPSELPPNPEPPIPSPRTPKRAYKARTPKPRFVEPGEAEKATAIKEVEADRLEAARAEAERRKRRPNPESRLSHPGVAQESDFSAPHQTAGAFLHSRKRVRGHDV